MRLVSAARAEFATAIRKFGIGGLSSIFSPENYSPDDNRFDLRPFLSNPSFDVQFAAIDQLVHEAEAASASRP